MPILGQPGCIAVAFNQPGFETPGPDLPLTEADWRSIPVSPRHDQGLTRNSGSKVSKYFHLQLLHASSEMNEAMGGSDVWKTPFTLPYLR